METVKVNKAKLIEVITKNRDAHRTIFDKAVVRFREALLTELESRISQVKANKPVMMTIGLLQPEDHTSDYDRVLKMLNMSIDVDIELDENDFVQYVEDDWHWKRQWFANTASYAAMPVARKRRK